MFLNLKSRGKFVARKKWGLVMRKLGWPIRIFVAAVILHGLPGAIADDVPPPSAGLVLKFPTTPSDKRSPYFSDVGIVKELLVKPGDVVKAGQIVASQDSDLEQLEYESMKIQAESTAKIEYAKADRDSKKLVRDRLQAAFDSGGAANGTELEEAKLALSQAEIQIKAAQEEHNKNLADLAKQARKLEKMRLLSPIDGIVEKINVFAGEMADPGKQDGVLTIVCNRPLWADIHVPTAEAASLKVGDNLPVAYENEPNNWFSGRIILFSPEADAASNTQTVRLELTNEEQKPAGLWLNIRLSGPGAGTEAKAR
jgi:RND family efflux transporter MFP subunit